MSKSRDAFRTISEVSDALDTPAHVLRFWESKFTQVKPVKRAGGRRYYRPGDVDLLAGIKQLLHDDGMTIKGAQKLLREQGVKHVAGLGANVLGANVLEADVLAKSDTPAPVEAKAETAAPKPAPEPKPDEVVEPPKAAAPQPDTELDITNVVPLPATPATSAPKGPALSLNLSAKDTPQQDAPTPTPATAPVSAPPAAAPSDIPADPSDSDSKAPARFFNHLHSASHDKLARRAKDIVPLLSRMQSLRDRIEAR